jgi:multimeric flavodoxin WrbA
VFDVLEKSGIETEIIQIGGKVFRGCTGCRKCSETKNEKCIFDDKINGYIQKVKSADILILGSPVYFSDVTSEMKAFIDRIGYVTRSNGFMLKRKIGAAVIAVRRAGAIPSFDSINHFFLINEMIVPGSSYWNLGIGREKGDVVNDIEGMKTMQTLGENIAWLANKIKE